MNRDEDVNLQPVIHVQHQDLVDIREILERRANELATFREDLEQRVTKLLGQPVRFAELPGSVELALTREIKRLRWLAKVIIAVKPTFQPDMEDMQLESH